MVSCLWLATITAHCAHTIRVGWAANEWVFPCWNECRVAPFIRHIIRASKHVRILWCFTWLSLPKLYNRSLILRHLMRWGEINNTFSHWWTKPRNVSGLFDTLVKRYCKSRLNSMHITTRRAMLLRVIEVVAMYYYTYSNATSDYVEYVMCDYKIESEFKLVLIINSHLNILILLVSKK